MDVDVLNRDLLLAFAAVTIERLHQGGRRPGQLASLAKALLTSLKGLLGEHGAPIALHGGVVGRDELGCEHPLKLVLRADSDQGLDRR